MGLRINTNISSIRALRTLRENDRMQSRSLERLSTGLRINRGSDDPSGLVISEQLRSQIHALEQSVSNSQNASNLISVADAALGEVSTLLVQIQDSIVFAQNTGGSTPDQIAAEQDAVDQAVAAIDRIASTTRFADRPLLNGNSEFQIASSLADFFDDVETSDEVTPYQDAWPDSDVIGILAAAQVSHLDPAAGLDDFIALPLQPAEFLARVHQILWRHGRGASRNTIAAGDLVLDLSNYHLFESGRPITLTYKEYELLRFLMTHAGTVFNRETVLNRVWGYNYYGGSRTVDVHIRRLRSKLDGSRFDYIETVRNVGYRFAQSLR